MEGKVLISFVEDNQIDADDLVKQAQDSMQEMMQKDQDAVSSMFKS